MHGSRNNFKMETHSWLLVFGWYINFQTYLFNMDSIDAAIAAGLIVKTVICDQSPVNQNDAKALAITPEKPFFLHKDHKVYFIYDVPHLLKTLRNNKGKNISWKHIVSACTSKNPLRARLLPKITAEHLNITNMLHKCSVIV
jgi:hypothetical protein